MDRLNKIVGESSISRALFMGEDIVGYANNTCMLIPGHNTQDGTKSRAHKRHPVTDDKDIRHGALDAQTGTSPINGIDRIDKRDNSQVSRGGSVRELGLARKEDRGILKRVGINGDIIPEALKFTRKSFVKIGKATT
jgi:hypothetical protein